MSAVSAIQRGKGRGTSMGFSLFGKKKSSKDKGALEAYLGEIMLHAMELRRTEVAGDGELPLGTSKVGGKPHLPAGFVWPRFEAEDCEGEVAERPLSFVAQIDLAAATTYDIEHRLPESGFLYFFYDVISQPWGFEPEDSGGAKVYYYDVSADALSVVEFPKDMADEAKIPLSRIDFRVMDELPGYEEFCDLTDTARFGESFDWDSYDETVEGLIEIQDCSPDEVCKLLGYADLIQGSILYDCAKYAEMSDVRTDKKWQDMTAAEKEAFHEEERKWVLLAQFGTLSDEVMFGDCGSIYFYIRREDLAARRFDRTHICLQCG